MVRKPIRTLPLSELVSVEYNSGTGLYEPWTARPAPSPVTLDSGVDTATIDLDSQGRMWLASDGNNTINVRYSDLPYNTWSGPIELESGVSTDDISVVTALPNGSIAVLWSNQMTKRFGFRTHADGADPNTWSGDEVPASQSASNAGCGMADDHLNVAVASDGTLYGAVKTGFADVIAACGVPPNPELPTIALLVRRPDGTWDDLYLVTHNGTRGIVLLNEAAGIVSVIYTRDSGAPDILARHSSTSEIAFGSADTLMTHEPGDLLDNATSTKQNITDEAVILAWDQFGSSTVKSVLCTINTNRFVGWWPMEEGSGTAIIDMSGLENDGTIFGAPSWVAGISGTALNLDGANDYVLLPDTASLDIADAITLAAWVRPEMVDTQCLVKKTIDGSGDGYELSLSANGTAFGRLNETTNGNTFRVNANSAYPTDGTTWTHVAMTYDGGVMRLYVDGTEEDSLAESTVIGTNSFDLGIGAQSDGAFKFQGALDDVRVYCRALAPGEIEALANPCPLDCGGDDDGTVGITDFLVLLAQWGGPGTCDFDGGGVGINDFLALLAVWGPCP